MSRRKINTVYLACDTTECLINDIRKEFPGYNGEQEYKTAEGCVHLIGDIPEAYDEAGNPVSWVGKQHANIYVPEDFDATVFRTRMPEPPDNPVNRLAI